MCTALCGIVVPYVHEHDGKLSLQKRVQRAVCAGKRCDYAVEAILRGGNNRFRQEFPSMLDEMQLPVGVVLNELEYAGKYVASRSSVDLHGGEDLYRFGLAAAFHGEKYIKYDTKNVAQNDMAFS